MHTFVCDIIIAHIRVSIDIFGVKSMSDYIDILLSALEEEMYSYLGEDYFLSLHQSGEALAALSDTFTPQQQALFRAYDDARSKNQSAYQDTYARRAFLLARAVYR